jgi:hypothetical protein
MARDYLYFEIAQKIIQYIMKQFRKSYFCKLEKFSGKKPATKIIIIKQKVLSRKKISGFAVVHELYSNNSRSTTDNS